MISQNARNPLSNSTTSVASSAPSQTAVVHPEPSVLTGVTGEFCTVLKSATLARVWPITLVVDAEMKDSENFFFPGKMKQKTRNLL
jgi:hypothetical protein